MAGRTSPGALGDNGPATAATLSLPRGVAVDEQGNLYIADTGNNRIRKVGTDGIIRTIAGNGTAGSTGDGGPASAATINQPWRLAADRGGNVFIAESGGARIRRIDAAGIITTVAGGGNSTAENIPATSARLGFAQCVAVDSAGNLYICQSTTVRKVNTAGLISTVAGTGALGYSGDGGPAIRATFRGLLSVAVAADGTIYIADTNNQRIRAVNPGGIVNTVAGNGLFRVTPDGGPAIDAKLNLPTGVALDNTGNLFIADASNHRIRKVTPAGASFVIAGTGLIGSSPNGTRAVEASLNNPYSVAVDTLGNLFIADSFSSVIRKVDASGTLTITAGGGTSTADGVPATTARLGQPQGIAIGSDNVIYIADTLNHKVRKITADGLITTVAGTGIAGFSGDNGPGIQAQLNTPRSVAVDSAGNVYITDLLNNRVRKVSPGGTIVTVAGNGNLDSLGSIPVEGASATTVPLTRPSGVAVDGAGIVYVSAGSRVFSVASGAIRTVAGSRLSGFSGDGGPATRATLDQPWGLTAGSAGDLFIADQGNNLIRAVLAAPPPFFSAPNSLSFTANAGGSPADSQSVSLTGPIPGLSFSITGVPAWLSVTPISGALPSVVQFVADPREQAPGTLSATLTINVPDASPASRTISVTFNVNQASPPKLSITETNLTFSSSFQGAATLRHVAVSNSGGSVLPFTATSSTASGGAWLRLLATSGSATPANPVLLGVEADPGRLPPGVYTGNISIASAVAGAAADGTVSIAVILTITAVRQTIQLSQSGLTFTAVAQGGFVLPQSFAVANTGQGAMSWTAQSSTLSGGQWLSVFPPSGSSGSTSAEIPSVEVQVNPAALDTGTYYGRVTIAAPGADNSPQVVMIVLNVLAPGSNPGPTVQTTSLTFTGAAGGAELSTQNLLLGNPAGRALSYVSARITLDGADWFSVFPPTGSVAGQQATTLVVQPDITNLAAGVRRGILTLRFSDDSSLGIHILLVLTSGSGASTSITRNADGCAPTRLLPAMSSLSQDFTRPAAWPTPIVARVVDDCNEPMVTGSVTATFSNGDPPLSLVSLKDGSWSATWHPRNTDSTTRVIVSAQIPERSLEGRLQISGTLQANTDPPQIVPGGVLSAASFAQDGVLAPGSIISIYGSRLGEGINVASQYPLGIELAGTQVFLSGASLPLYFTTSNQINAMVPVEAQINTRQLLLVRRASKLAVPEPVTIAAAQPAVFTPSQTGKGQGYVLVQTPAGAQVLADAANPATAGDAVVIYCSGLGTTNPPVVSGAPASLTALSPTANPVTLTIGGRNASVLFAGLTPGFVGLYQVNAIVPASVSPDDQAPVVLTVGGQSSPTVTMSVR